MLPLSSGSKNKPSKKQALVATCFMSVSCLAYCSAHVLLKHRLTFNGLHGVISEKLEPFITTAVIISNPTCQKSLNSLNHTYENIG
jgi:hypothetical protein